MENAHIADIFDEIADLVELDEGNPFRIRSYRNAARTIRSLPRRLEDMVAHDGDLSQIPNVGSSTADKIREILDTGTCGRLEEMRAKVPPGLTRMMQVPQLGPRKAMQLHRELGITSLDELREACEAGRVRDLEGMGAKTEANILEGLELLERTAGRVSIAAAAEHVASLGRHLDAASAVLRWEVAGSFRRRKETIGDLDILIRAQDRDRAAEQILGLDDIAQVLGRGSEKISVRLSDGLQIDFRFFEEAGFGAALMYFTGSKAHNIKLRRLAQERDWKLNEYGLTKGDHLLAGATEESVYHRLDLPWIPPELREDRGEIEAAAADELPRLIELGHIRGDLQSHTNATDGSSTIAEMASSAAAHGYSYFAVTDHSKEVTMAGGLDDDAALAHVERIREVDQNLDCMWLLAGIEVDILKSGKLDLAASTLEKMDWVVAAVHYNMHQPEREMTERLVAAISSGLVHCLGHPTGRLLGRRDAMAFDMDRVIEACVEHGVVIEINAQPERLDLPDAYCQRALEAGATFAISTDAHKPSDLDLMTYGVNVARRGWLSRGDVINTRTVRQFRKALRRR